MNICTVRVWMVVRENCSARNSIIENGVKYARMLD
jgi:hypothetical protein